MAYRHPDDNFFPKHPAVGNILTELVTRTRDLQGNFTKFAEQIQKKAIKLMIHNIFTS